MTIAIDPTLKRADLCSITLAGNLVQAPEIRYQANPVLAIADITIATHSRWFDKLTNSYKEWTNYHNAKVVGDIVEQHLLQAQKGDVVLLQGHLSHQKQTAKEILLATFIQVFAKGYSQEINQLQCSGKLTTPFRLITTDNHKIFAEAKISIVQQVSSYNKLQKHNVVIERPVHIWGKQAQYLTEKAQQGDDIIIEGKLSYINNTTKSQLIDAKQILLVKGK
jgi:single-stranded DNA-binding protein